MMSILSRRTLAGLAVVLMLGLLIPTFAAPGDADKPQAELPSDLALVPHDALWFSTFRVADIVRNKDVKSLLPLLSSGRGETTVQDFEKTFGLKTDGIERVTVACRRMQAERVWIFHTSKAYDKDAFLKHLGDTVETKVHGKTIVMSKARSRSRLSSAVWMPDDRTIVQSRPDALVPYLAALARPGKTHPFADELKVASGKHPVVVALLPSMIFRSIDAESHGMRKRGYKEGRPVFEDGRDKEKRPPPDDKDGPPTNDLNTKDAPPSAPRNRAQKERPGFDPDRFKEEPLKLRSFDEIYDSMELDEMRVVTPLFRARRALLTIDLADGVEVKARADFDSEDQVKDAEVLGRMWLYLLRETFPASLRNEMRLDMKAKGLATLFGQFKDAVRASEVKRDGKTLEVTGKAKLDLAPLAKYIAEIAPIRADENNLKQIGLAFMNYEGTMRYMPQAAICDKAGEPLLSWRVAILPYIEQDQLYRQFKLDEAWDSPHNKKLIDKMPKIYAPPAGKVDEPNVTFYQVFTGPNTLYPRPDTKVRISSIPDGTSNTILVAEASKAVIWSKPADIVVPAKGKLPKLGGQFAKFFNAAFCDGTVKQIKRDFDHDILRAVITPAGGEVIDDSKLKP